MSGKNVQTRGRCAFCRTEFGKDPHVQSAEHILYKARLKELDLWDVQLLPVRVDGRSGVQSLHSKPPRAGSLTQRGICKACNESWMERSDDQVISPIIRSQLKTPRLANLAKADREALAWWALRITATRQLLFEPEKRTVPNEFYDLIYRRIGNGEPILFPEGAVAFIARCPDQGVTDVPVRGQPLVIGGFRIANYFAGLVQYRSLMIGVAWTSDPQVAPLIFVSGIHLPIFPRRARLIWVTTPVMPMEDMACVPANAVLSSIGMLGDPNADSGVRDSDGSAISNYSHRGPASMPEMMGVFDQIWKSNRENY